MEKTPHYRVIVSNRFHQMLADHLRFLAQENPSIALKLKNELMDAVRSLGQMPQRYPYLQAQFIPPNKYHRMLVAKRYLVLYQIKAQTVYVDYIVDCRQDYQWLVQ
jgi:plasmid stabilization system protein ParE